MFAALDLRDTTIEAQGQCTAASLSSAAFQTTVSSSRKH